jgi:hypothetical protein
MAFYVNVTDRYACPYYSDRVDHIAPELNRVLQFLRTFRMNVVFLPHPTHKRLFLDQFPSLKSHLHLVEYRHTARSPPRDGF